jgi:hypothetical protein
MDYTVTLDATQAQAFTSIAISTQEWIQNAATARADIAVDSIVQLCVTKCLETGTPIPATKAEMVSLAFAEGWVAPAEAPINGA